MELWKWGILVRLVLLTGIQPNVCHSFTIQCQNTAMWVTGFHMHWFYMYLCSGKAFAQTYVGTPYYVSPEIWDNKPYNNKRYNFPDNNSLRLTALHLKLLICMYITVTSGLLAASCMNFAPSKTRYFPLDILKLYSCNDFMHQTV